MNINTLLGLAVEPNRVRHHNLVSVYGKEPHNSGVSRSVERSGYSEVLVEVGFGKSRFDDCPSGTPFEFATFLNWEDEGENLRMSRPIPQTEQSQGKKSNPLCHFFHPTQNQRSRENRETSLTTSANHTPGGRVRKHNFVLGETQGVRVLPRRDGFRAVGITLEDFAPGGAVVGKLLCGAIEKKRSRDSISASLYGPNLLRYSCEVTKPVTIPRGSLVVSNA